MGQPALNTPAATTPYVLVADVPWPRHKLFAVVSGVVALVLLGVVTTSAAPSVLGAAGVAVAVATLLKFITYRRD